MVISDLHILGVAVCPAEADPPLIVDTNAPLILPITGKLLQPVAGRNAQEVKGGGAVELFQFALGNALYVLRQFCRITTVKQLLRLFASE
jgi:hypothetical protein